MKTFIIVYAIIIVITLVISIIEQFYYDRKLPDESLEEINQKIQSYENKLKLETDILRQSEILDLIEYWNQQKDKLITSFDAKTGDKVIVAIDLDGKPYGVPLNFVWDGDDAIYIHCAPEGKKIDILDCHDRVSFCVVGNVNLLPSQFTTEYESIILDCEATICTSEEERVHALELLLRKLSPHDVEIGMKYALKSLPRTCILRLDILTWSGKAKRVKR